MVYNMRPATPRAAGVLEVWSYSARKHFQCKVVEFDIILEVLGILRLESSTLHIPHTSKLIAPCSSRRVQQFFFPKSSAFEALVDIALTDVISRSREKSSNLDVIPSGMNWIGI